GLVAEHADRHHLGWEPLDDVAHGPHAHLAGAGGEHEAHGVGSEGGRHQGVLLVGDAADLHEHGSNAIGTDATVRGGFQPPRGPRGTRSAASAAPGAAAVTRCSPTRTAGSPAAASASGARRPRTPDAAARTVPAGMAAATRTARAVSTS